MTILPISKSTLRYGSSDAGRTIFNDPVFSEKMKQASEILNIKPHICGFDEDQKKLLHSAIDVEGHLGTDGKLYLLDFARVCENNHHF